MATKTARFFMMWLTLGIAAHAAVQPSAPARALLVVHVDEPSTVPEAACLIAGVALLGFVRQRRATQC